jgi:hypothetical protein
MVNQPHLADRSKGSDSETSKNTWYSFRATRIHLKGRTCFLGATQHFIDVAASPLELAVRCSLSLCYFGSKTQREAVSRKACNCISSVVWHYSLEQVTYRSQIGKGSCGVFRLPLLLGHCKLEGNATEALVDRFQIARRET